MARAPSLGGSKPGRRGAGRTPQGGNEPNLATPQSGGYALGQSISHLCHRAQQFAAERFTEDFGAKEPTLRQFALLAAVAEKPGQTQTDLVRATGIDRSTLADMITRMEKKSLLQRNKSENDKRAKVVSLTKAGAVLLERATPSAQKADEALMAAVPTIKRAGLLSSLQAVAEAAAARPVEGDEAAPERKAKARAARGAEVKPGSRSGQKRKAAAPERVAKKKKDKDKPKKKKKR